MTAQERTVRVCAITGCQGKYLANGYCNRHLHMVRLYGEPEPPRAPTQGFRARSHPMYWKWRAMLVRCYTPTNRFYPRYGGRGITVCPEWRDFWTFLFDMGVAPEGKSLDRIDNDGPYAPWNCRWATNLEQAGNRSDTKLIEYEGQRKHLTDWARHFGVAQSRLRYHYRKRGLQAFASLRAATQAGEGESREA